MLATIILDSFTKVEAPEIAAALDMICAPDETYGFASACIYAFWSIPDRNILYIGLAGDVTVRFRQHTGIRACEPECCKRREIEDYFARYDRLGYTVMVQSTNDQPATVGEKIELAELYDELFADDVADFFQGKENIQIAEGFLIELHRKLGDRLPTWNKIQGSELGRRQRSLSDHRERIRAALETARSGRVGNPPGVPEHLPYELLLNLTGEELSYLNARSTLREIASDNTIEGHEEFLHAVRLDVLLNGSTVERAIERLVAHQPIHDWRAKAMTESGYLHRTPPIPGISRPASGEGGRGHAPRQ
ncbi:hypothetical protein J0H58_13275 [bacterium]|nr:hypothetical protein [bacterium]